MISKRSVRRVRCVRRARMLHAFVARTRVHSCARFAVGPCGHCAMNTQTDVCLCVCVHEDA